MLRRHQQTHQIIVIVYPFDVKCALFVEGEAAEEELPELIVGEGARTRQGCQAGDAALVSVDEDEEGSVERGQREVGHGAQVSMVLSDEL